MARKSFKKGVKNVIDSIDNDRKQPKASAPKAAQPKRKPAGSKPVKKAPAKKEHNEYNLGSRFVVQESASAMEKFNEALNQTTEIDIVSDEVTELDLSFVQMILAFHELAEKKKLKLLWKLRFSDDIIKSIQSAGLYDALNPFFDESMAEVVANG